MKIISWNINSIKARSHLIENWLDKACPDLLFLQEIKTVNELFPREVFEQRGYHLSLNGQKGYHGVAIASKVPVQTDLMKLPGDEEDVQCRFLQVDIQGVKFINIYLPNGNPVDTEKYPYKLKWMDRLINHAKSLIEQEVPFLIAGDYNVIPTDKDVYEPNDWRDDALFRVETRNKFRQLCNLGLTEAFDALHPHRVQYSFWDYQKGRWPRNEGIRIDHFLLSPHLADQLISCDVDEETRALEKTSDHAPVVCELDIFNPDRAGAFVTNLAKLAPSL